MPQEEPMRVLSALLSALVILAAGCSNSGKVQSKEAVQKAIETYLAQRQNLMLANMNLEVEDVKFAGDTAEAEVKFRSKQSADLVVGVHYKLKLDGDRWQVESSNPSGGMGGSPHGGAPAAPPHAPAETPLQSSH
jgi:hypothetical protein